MKLDSSKIPLLKNTKISHKKVKEKPVPEAYSESGF